VSRAIAVLTESHFRMTWAMKWIHKKFVKMTLQAKKNMMLVLQLSKRLDALVNKNTRSTKKGPLIGAFSFPEFSDLLLKGVQPGYVHSRNEQVHIVCSFIGHHRL